VSVLVVSRLLCVAHPPLSCHSDYHTVDSTTAAFECGADVSAKKLPADSTLQALDAAVSAWRTAVRTVADESQPRADRATAQEEELKLLQGYVKMAMNEATIRRHVRAAWLLHQRMTVRTSSHCVYLFGGVGVVVVVVGGVGRRRTRTVCLAVCVLLMASNFYSCVSFVTAGSKVKPDEVARLYRKVVLVRCVYTPSPLPVLS